MNKTQNIYMVKNHRVMKRLDLALDVLVYRDLKHILWSEGGSYRAVCTADTDINLKPHKGWIWKDDGRGSRVLEFL